VDDYEVTWNFWKFLCDEDGDLMEVFAPDEMEELIEYLLSDDEGDDDELLADDNAFHFGQVWFFPEEVEIPFDEKTLQIISFWMDETAVAEKSSIEEIRLVFCSDEGILDLNKQILKHDYYTDVITCPLNEPDEPIDADIYISTDRTADNAKTYGISPQHELCRVIIHSILHLCGHDDETPELRQAMHEKENFYLAKLAKVYDFS
jgi:rRNA maturation RNase YbeY